MATLLRSLSLLAAVLAASCASSSVATSRGPVAEVPVFAPDDPRVETAGFVRETLRLSREEDGVRYTLMAFVVGDTLTLGAMVSGEFRGMVRWKVGGRQLSAQFDTTDEELPAIVFQGEQGIEIVGQAASFRDTSWVNVEVPVADWLADGTPLQLVFRPRTGEAVWLPDDGYHYVVRLVGR